MKAVWIETSSLARLEMRKIKVKAGTGIASGGFDGMSLGIALNAIWTVAETRDCKEDMDLLRRAFSRACAGRREDYETRSDIRLIELYLKTAKRYIRQLKGEN